MVILSATPWALDAGVDSADVAHRKAGLWAIDSLNPNAWPAALDYMQVAGADFALVQEEDAAQVCLRRRHPRHP